MLREQTAELLSRYGLRIDAALDEQQLIDPAAIEALVEAVGVAPTDTALEVGPGVGNLTAALASRVEKVIAVEKSEKYLPLLMERFSGYPGVEVVAGDALTIRLPPFDVLVSNPPYAIAEALIHRIERSRFRAASLLVPSKLANTLSAERGEPDYTKLTLETHLFFDVKLASEVNPGSYYPEPDTTTSIVVLRPRIETRPVETVLREMLHQGDKKAGNALREAMIAVASLGFPPTKRAAEQAVERLGLGDTVLDERVARLSLDEVLLVYKRLDDVWATAPSAQ